MHPRSALFGALLGIPVLAFAALAAANGPSSITLLPGDRQPPEAGARLSPERAEALRRQVSDHPDDRAKRVTLVRSLLVSGDLDGALAEAKAWRSRDAYNLVAVRALGDVYMERGEKDAAERVYSAIVELLPGDPDAQRALATLLKEKGDLVGAQARLEAALGARPDDARLMFELADIEARRGATPEAQALFGKVLASDASSEQIRYPARRRLAQLEGELRRQANASGDAAKAKEWTAALESLGLSGGLENDIHIDLSWDTDRTDVDLWVTTPSGEKIFYQHKTGAGGEALFDDVTTGYGPEVFTVRHARAGDYKVQVNYYSARRGPFPEARGEVSVVLDEGRARERRQVLPYRLFAEKETVTVATIHVEDGR